MPFVDPGEICTKALSRDRQRRLWTGILHAAGIFIWNTCWELMGLMAISLPLDFIHIPLINFLGIHVTLMKSSGVTIWLFNIAVENHHFIAT